MARSGETEVVVRADGRVGNRSLAVEDGHRRGALMGGASLRDPRSSRGVVAVVWWCCLVVVANAPQTAANTPEGGMDAIVVIWSSAVDEKNR